MSELTAKKVLNKTRKCLEKPSSQACMKGSDM